MEFKEYLSETTIFSTTLMECLHKLIPKENHVEILTPSIFEPEKVQTKQIKP